eukprot:IDg5595t1
MYFAVMSSGYCRLCSASTLRSPEISDNTVASRMTPSSMVLLCSMKRHIRAWSNSMACTRARTDCMASTQPAGSTARVCARAVADQASTGTLRIGNGDGDGDGGEGGCGFARVYSILDLACIAALFLPLDSSVIEHIAPDSFNALCNHVELLLAILQRLSVAFALNLLQHAGGHDDTVQHVAAVFEEEALARVAEIDGAHTSNTAP